MLEDNEFGTLGSLLGNLLGLNSAGEISRELQVCDRNVIEDDVEFQSAFAEDLTDLLGNLFSLRNKLFGVVLSDD